MGRHYIHEYLTPSESEALNLMNIMPTHMWITNTVILKFEAVKVAGTVLAYQCIHIKHTKSEICVDYFGCKDALYLSYPCFSYRYFHDNVSSFLITCVVSVHICSFTVNRKLWVKYKIEIGVNWNSHNKAVFIRV